MSVEPLADDTVHVDAWMAQTAAIRIVSIEGNIGVGKSTLLEKLMDAWTLEARGKRYVDGEDDGPEAT